MQPIQIKSLATQKISNRQMPVHRYYFQWLNRVYMGSVSIRMELLDQAGKLIDTCAIALPRTQVKTFSRVLGAESITEHLYEQPQFFYIEYMASGPAIRYRYTARFGLFRKSVAVEEWLNVEDAYFDSDESETDFIKRILEKDSLLLR